MSQRSLLAPKICFRVFSNIRGLRYEFKTSKFPLIIDYGFTRGYFRSAGSSFARPAIKKQLNMDSLPGHILPHEIIEIESGEEPSTDYQKMLTAWKSDKTSMRSSESDYLKSFRTMIDFEEAAEHVQREKCNQEDVQLHHVVDNEFFFFVKPEMKDLCLYTKQFDQFILRSKDGSMEQIDGTIILKQNTKIFVELDGFISNWDENQLYDIIFHNNRTFHLLQQQALNYVKHHKLFDALIDNPKYKLPLSNGDTNEAEYEDLIPSTIEDLNEEQKLAVNRMIKGDNFPLPYLLYGPPGTGKTKTLAAAIKNIVRNTEKNVLVCAQSNAACDELTNRLRGFLTRDEMFRMYSKSKDLDVISSSFKAVSNLFGGELKYPPLDFIYKYRVVICTLATAGCLVRANCDPDHFSYVVIDECASALEPITLVPIAGLCTTAGKVHANIILSGDPKQLDAVTKSEWASELGFGISWLEQLFKFPLYHRDALTGKFNSKYITQLVKNYRNHPAILHVPNQLFYEGVLEAKVSPDIADLNIDIPELNANIPIIFKSVQGNCVKPEYDTSSYNVEEVVEVTEFVRKLLQDGSDLRQSDIGVVSPYRLQCEMIRVTLKQYGLSGVTVGTAETFQGQERKVIIASTVSSRNESLGSFVSDPQRMNVMATRAQYLLVIIGDPHTLNKDPNWSAFIKYCYENGNLIQSDSHFTPEAQAQN